MTDAVAAEIAKYIQLERTGTFQPISKKQIHVEIDAAIVADNDSSFGLAPSDPDLIRRRDAGPRRCTVATRL